MWKKSVASMLVAWARRKSRQLGPVRLGAGPRRWWRSTPRTAVADTETPSFFSSPTTRR